MLDTHYQSGDSEQGSLEGHPNSSRVTNLPVSPNSYRGKNLPVSEGANALKRPKPPMVKTGTPGVYKRGSRYVVAWRDRGYQRKRSFRTYDEARKFKGSLDKGDTRIAPSNERFDKFARQWIATHPGLNGQFSEATRKAYAATLERYAIPFLGRYKLSAITSRELKQFVAHLEDTGMSPISVVTALAPVKSLFKSAVQDQLLTVNPAATVRVNRKRAAQPTVTPPPVAHRVSPMILDHTHLTSKMVADILAHVPDHYSLMFRVFCETGARSGEVFGLEWRDLSQVPPAIRIERAWNKSIRQVTVTKTRAGNRTVPITPELAADLMAARGQANLQVGDLRGRPKLTNSQTLQLAELASPIFTTRSGKHYSYRNVLRVLVKAASDAGIEHPIGFHSFRHWRGSQLLQSGHYTVIQVAALLGHEDPTITTRIYLHAMEGLGDALPLPTATSTSTSTALSAVK